MSMEMWILSLCLIAIEIWGDVYFFDIFMERKKTGRFGKYRLVFLYIVSVVIAYIGDEFVSMWMKVLLAVFVLVIFSAVFYEGEWKQYLFFSGLNYSLLFLADIMTLLAENILNSKQVLLDLENYFIMIPMKMVRIILLFILRRIWKGNSNYNELSKQEWHKFCVIPVFTVASMLIMYFCYSGDKKVQTAYLFLSFVLIFINIFTLELMQDILVRSEKLRESALTDQKKESQLSHYRDMQSVYERQGRKMHDYKNQIRTVQTLLKKEDKQAAIALAERLTESISVEMAAVNTNHPVVDAVLNQKFHAAREQGVSMIFKVGDMGGLRLDEEETVILLSNLLDNAIHECVKVVWQGRKAVIHVKLVQENGKLIFSVRNPVAEKVQTTEGIGLMNVKAVVDKYDGDFAVSCDEEKFQAVVIL